MCAGGIMQLVRNQHLRKTLHLRRSLLISRCRLSVCTLIKEGEYHASACSDIILIRINCQTDPYFKELIGCYISNKTFIFLLRSSNIYFIFPISFLFLSCFYERLFTFNSVKLFRILFLMFVLIVCLGFRFFP